MNRQQTIKGIEKVGRETNPMVHEYGYRVNEKGDKYFCKIGERDISVDINSYADQCDYTVIMKALNPPLDFDYDNLLETVDFDVTDVLAVQAHMSVIEEEFQYLPKEVKSEYSNDYRKFARSVFDGSFADKYISVDESAEDSQNVEQDVGDVQVPNTRTVGVVDDQLASLTKQVADLTAKLEKGE